MQKQISYPKFIPRVFSMMIDIVILSVALVPVMQFFAENIYLYIFNDFFVQNNIDTSSKDAIFLSMRLPAFAEYITASRFFTYLGSVFVINTIFMGAYFIIFWRKCGTTPGKMLMRMKIVDADDYHSRPSTYNFIKRFCWYVTAFIGIWSMVFSKKGMALHDKAANTIVIKS